MNNMRFSATFINHNANESTKNVLFFICLHIINSIFISEKYLIIDTTLAQIQCC